MGIITPSARLQKKEDAITRMRKVMPATRHVAATTVAGATGISVGTLRRWLDNLHAAGELHVVDWKAGSRNFAWVPVFADGPGNDVPPPVGDNSGKVKMVKIHVRSVETDDMAFARIRREAKENADAAAKRGCTWLQQFYGRNVARGNPAHGSA